MRGTLPDMAASSDRFVELQRCFSEQARVDAAAVRAHALRLFNELGRVRFVHHYFTFLDSKL